MATEVHPKPQLVTSREPVAPALSGVAESIGDMAFKDTVLIVILAWVVLFLLAATLRQHNI